MKCPIRPTSLRVIVKEDGFKYTGAIHIPDAAKRRPTSGVVEAIGDSVGRWSPAAEGEESTFTPSFEIGDHVVYGLYSGTVINFKGWPAYRSLAEDEIIGWIPSDIELEGVGT